MRLLDLGFFRIGGERYAEENETFGLATLRRAPRRDRRAVASFRYTAKGAQAPPQEIADPLVVPTMKELKDRDGGGYELLAYRAVLPGEVVLAGGGCLGLVSQGEEVDLYGGCGIDIVEGGR